MNLVSAILIVFIDCCLFGVLLKVCFSLLAHRCYYWGNAECDKKHPLMAFSNPFHLILQGLSFSNIVSDNINSGTLVWSFLLVSQCFALVTLQSGSNVYLSDSNLKYCNCPTLTSETIFADTTSQLLAQCV